MPSRPHMQANLRRGGAQRREAGAQLRLRWPAEPETEVTVVQLEPVTRSYVRAVLREKPVVEARGVHVEPGHETNEADNATCGFDPLEHILAPKPRPHDLE